MTVTVTSNPGNGCCGCGGTDCEDCPDAPFYWEVVVEGVTDAECTDCESWNRTYRMGYDSGCTWIEHFLIGCGAERAVIQLSNPSGVALIIEFIIQTAGAATIAEWRLIGGTCAGPNVLTLLTDLSDCATLPATVTVTAA